MFLKRIELSGFKSFADRTELEFVQGITAVVGPNGSGKSNISDGIRWVLGEQSARSLRGGKMEDVIFAGSDARKAVNYGEVSLTLDNASQTLPLDFGEVTVTRRVHRSGDSEYFINKQACRLKDITELFMDTGIGKEAYSSIGQGRIEEILSTKSEDRRSIFEEASGIVKYKSRKKEAEKKLADTEQNLLRIHDLVSELDAQVEPLRKQSEKAVRFKQLKETLKKSEIALYVHEIEGIHAAWEEGSQKLVELGKEQEKLSTVVQLHDAHLEEHRLAERRLEDEVNTLQATLLRLSEEVEKNEGYGEVLRERKKHFGSNRETLLQSITSQQTRIEGRQIELSEQQGKLTVVTQDLQELEKVLKEEEIRLLGVSGGLGTEAEELLKTELLEIMNAIAAARNDIRYAEQQSDSLNRRLEKLEEERQKWSKQQDELVERRKLLDGSIEEATRALDEVRTKYVEATRQLREKEKAAEEEQVIARKVEGRMDALISRRDTMVELQDDFDGFMHGVKEVLKAKRNNHLKGIRGAVAELVRVPAEVEVAVETALGGALQNVVVETEKDGRTAIAFLKQRQLGRATFLPMDVIRGRSISDNERRAMQEAAGFVGVAVDLVSFETEYTAIIASLLGNVVIAETLEDANRIAAKVGYRYRVVTREGDVVNAGGSMTGGSHAKKTANLLGRKRQIEELEKEIVLSDVELKECKQRVANVKAEIAQANRDLQELRDLSETKRIEEQSLLSERSALNAEARSIDEGLSEDTQDRDSLKAERTEHIQKKEQSRIELAELEKVDAELQQKLRDAELARKASEFAKEELQEHLTGLKVKVAATSQVKQGLLAEQKRIEQELAQVQQELTDSQESLRQLERSAEMNEAESIAQLEALNQAKLRRSECAEQIEFKRAERADWLRKLEQEESHTREQRVALKEVESTLHATEVRVNRLDVELDNLLKKLSEEYELSYELAKERYPIPEDIPGAQSEVRELKREIASLGSVNLGAIEEYERVYERYDFLSAQQNDLIEAKTTLYGVIREMEDEMSKKFKTTFDAIRSHFGTVFSKLFGGGRADLILSEPDNLLETGIEIVAQPPGKKLQNLSLLSGGERALTAIALLFSILHVKPVPFCVLDEVEAALDEANVSRFAEYLREFAESTQFIVVTHRKGTMEEADVLYGVTMEEGGVSKLVSVRLEEEDSFISAS
ncbi:chromosome segregation protein SMC [Paenibacillus sp. KN14-4R]|uniref:chromosome segregation protein SMC n=1 Tax=Paenibacillus sp. KN14-4R TaxID=3445773 RepID=UPI003FA00782